MTKDEKARAESLKADIAAAREVLRAKSAQFDDLIQDKGRHKVPPDNTPASTFDRVEISKGDRLRTCAKTDVAYFEGRGWALTAPAKPAKAKAKADEAYTQE